MLIAEAGDEQRGLQWGRNMIVAEGATNPPDAATGAALQWGRNMIVAEGISTRPRAAPTWALQWGRNMIVAEGLQRRRIARTAQSFNGAAT